MNGHTYHHLGRKPKCGPALLSEEEVFPSLSFVTNQRDRVRLPHFTHHKVPWSSSVILMNCAGYQASMVGKSRGMMILTGAFYVFE